MAEINRIGIIGDGQLGRMMVEDGLRYNPELKFTVLGMAGQDSPAAQVGARQIEGGLKDPDAIRTLVEQSDVTTWEIEHIDADILADLEYEGHNIQPSPLSLQAIQDKYIQKRHLDASGIAVAPYRLLRGQDQLESVREALGGDLMVKVRRGGYDGRGNYLLKPHENWRDVAITFGQTERDTLYAEGLIPFKREVSLVGIRDMLGNIATYPVVETVHKNNICHTVLLDKDASGREAAEALGRATIATYDGAGVFAVEMFETFEGQFLVNEVAPRVHNSGHWTDLGAETSQFEQHIRAITGDKLGSTRAKACATMINILRTSDGIFRDYMRSTQTLENGLGHVRWYGKAPKPNTDRKIGHITAIDDDFLVAQERALELESTYVA